jgi:hypothetical protein
VDALLHLNDLYLRVLADTGNAFVRLVGTVVSVAQPCCFCSWRWTIHSTRARGLRPVAMERTLQIIDQGRIA